MTTGLSKSPCVEPGFAREPRQLTHNSANNGISGRQRERTRDPQGGDGQDSLLEEECEVKASKARAGDYWAKGILNGDGTQAPGLRHSGGRDEGATNHSSATLKKSCNGRGNTTVVVLERGNMQ